LIVSKGKKSEDEERRRGVRLAHGKKTGEDRKTSLTLTKGISRMGKGQRKAELAEPGQREKKREDRA
jgi:hypothetical protein